MADIADRLGEQVAAAKSRLHRARGLVREYMVKAAQACWPLEWRLAGQYRTKAGTSLPAFGEPRPVT